MAATIRTERPSMAALGGPEAVGLAALVATSGFRLGVLPGGLVGVDLALALAGWWLATSARDPRAWRAKVALGWRRWWTGLCAAVAVAIVWVLVADPVRWDDTVRGEALAGFGSYANWHQISRGPLESLATRYQSPLQHLWAVAVLVQCTAAWWVVVRLTRAAAARRSAGPDPSALVLGVLGAASFLGGVAMLAAGASGQVLLMATVPRATAFLLAAAAGATAGSPLGGAVVEGASYLRWVGLGLLVGVALVAGPQTDLGRIAGTTMVPLAAVVVVVAWGRGPATHGRGAWSALVATWFVLTPVVAVCRAAWVGASVVLVDLAGTLLAVAAGLALAALVDRLADDEPSVERRRVLVPPAVVALLVVMGSVTGAFHWESPQPRDQWPRAVGWTDPARSGPMAPRP